METAILRNRYRVIDRLGSGGVGSVYAVEEVRRGGEAGPRLALKALFAQDSQQALLDSLKLEFRVLATLRHPLIARVYDFGTLPPGNSLAGSEGRPGFFFTRDLIEGQDLEAHCKGRSIREICQVCQQTAEVLDILHRSGMVHGDFKPANVIVTPDGRPHLIDFGLVRSEGKSSLPSGTAAYLAPETLKGRKVDRRADLYALGISLYQLLAGRLPLPGASLGELINWHLDGEPLRVTVESSVPEELNSVIFRLTLRDPDLRFPSAAEAALALGAVFETSGARPAAAVTHFVPPAPGENLKAPLSELEQIVHRRVIAREGGSPLYSIEGGPGSGKTTLLQELAWRCQLAGVEVIRAEERSAAPRAFGLMTELMSQVADSVGLPHPLAESPPQEADQYAAYKLISEFLSRAAAHGPLLLLLDAVDQADEESWNALRFISHTLREDDPLLIVLAFQPSDTLYVTLGEPTRRQLDPLSLDDLTRMVADSSGRHDEPLAARILEHCAGNPLFAQEVLRLLHDAHWPANPDLTRLAPPRRLEDTYAARWQELTEGEQAVLQVLAVLGHPLTGAEILSLTMGLERQASQLVGLPLEHLEHLGWLDRNPDNTYAFRQGPAARVMYAAMEPERREALHLAAVRSMGRAEHDDPVEWTRHALGARRVDLAREHLDAAVAALIRVGSHRGAIQLFEELLPLFRGEPAGDDAPELRGIHAQLGELYSIVGDYDRAVLHLRQAPQSAVDLEDRIGLSLALAKVHRQSGEVGRAQEVLQEVLSQELSPALQITSLTESAALYLVQDRYEQVIATARRALELLEGDSPLKRPELITRAELQGQIAWSLGYQERFEEAADVYQAALEDARAAEAPRIEGTLLNGWASMFLRQADYKGATERYQAALACALSSGEVERVATMRYNLSTCHLWRGEYAAALEHLEESVRLFQAMAMPQRVAWARSGLGWLELKLGLYEKARTTLMLAIEESSSAGRSSIEAHPVLYLAQVQAYRGQLDQAQENIQKARHLFFEVGRKADAAECLLDLADFELAHGNPDAALEAIEQARSEVDLEQLKSQKVRAVTFWSRAIAINGTDSQRAQAALALSEAFQIARELDSPEILWECHASAMELADASGQPGRSSEHAVAAAQILEAMCKDLPPAIQTAFWQNSRRREVRDRVSLHQKSMQEPPAQGEPMNKPSSPVSPGAAAPGADAASDSFLGQTLSPSAISDSLPMERVIASVEERFYRLLEINRQINSELDPERLLRLVMNTAVELTGAERGFLLLGDDPTALKVEVAHNLDPEAEPGAYSRSIAEQVFTAGEPIITVSAHNDPRFKEYMSVHRLRMESVLCIPIHARNRTAGVLYMESRFQTGRFTPADQRLLMAFGDQVAIALTNARLMADNLRKTRELERAKAEIESLAEERGRQLGQRTQELAEVQRDLAHTRRQIETRTGMFGMIGRSAPMNKLFELVERVAATDVPILVEGESGTGKEMVARAIHNNSDRKRARLVSVNCAAIPEGLLESELFGHVRGAFTGADRERKGLFATAHDGTLFLDEIGDMPPRMQVDLLRALQEKTIRPVGGQKDIKVNVRVIAASNKPLTGLVQQGLFREDLYYRLNVVTLKLPALRERADDIPLLADFFLTNIANQMKKPKKRLTRDALRLLMNNGWPGNVRQLEHALMNASVLADSDVLDQSEFTLEAPIAGGAISAPQVASVPASTQGDHDSREKQQILEALEANNWNKSRAAEVLKMPRRTFYRRLKQYNIQ